MDNYISNTNRPATKKQLWALFCITKKDHRNMGLTIESASAMLKELNAHKQTTAQAKPKTDKLESEFLQYMSEKMQGIVSTARDALQVKSVVEDDPMFTDKNKQKQYAFFGFGCGMTIIDFDKRSKVGKQIKELGSKHRMSTFLNQFMSAFTPKERQYYESVGCPLSALYYQDIRISGAYDYAVADFMEHKGVKNVRTRTYYD